MMLKKAPRPDVAGFLRRITTWFRSGTSRIRLRRKLYLYSVPLLVMILAVAAKMISVVVAGAWSVTDFDRHDIEALRSDVEILKFVDVIDPAKTTFADADLKVLEGRLADAEVLFVESLSRTAPANSCPARVNLELVQETLGDVATRGNDRETAARWYLTAIDVVKDAPERCFAGNDDPNADRQAIRAEALPRLEAKLRNLQKPPEPTPPPPQPITPPPPPTSLTPTSGPPLPGLGGGGGADQSDAGGGADQAPSGGADQAPSGGADQAPSGGADQAPSGGADQAPSGGADQAPSGGADQAPSGGADQGQGAAPPPGPGANMPSPAAPEPTMTPGADPGQGPEGGPPIAEGGDAPIADPQGGIDILNPISPDRLPSVGGGSAPGQRLGVGEGDPLDRLRDLLNNANAHGENRE